jgi:hypothetical protein
MAPLTAAAAEKMAPLTAAAAEKMAPLKAAASKFKEDKLDPGVAALKEKMDEVAATFLAGFSNIAVHVLVGLFKTVQSLKTMFQILSTIAEISKFQAGQQQDAMKTKLNDLIAKLKASMSEFANNSELQACIDTLQSKGETGGVDVIDAPLTDVGKTCVYKDDGIEYQALVVGDRIDENNYHVLNLWINGLGSFKTVQYDLVGKGGIKFFDETSEEFTKATGTYGQSPQTISEARKIYEIPAPGAAADAQMTQSSTEEPSLISKAKDLVGNFMKSENKTQALLNIISGIKDVALSNLDRVSGRLQDPELKNCITQIKNALTAKIRKQLESLKSTSSQVPGVDAGQTQGQNAITVSDNKSGVVQNVRNSLSNYTKSFSVFGR